MTRICLRCMKRTTDSVLVPATESEKEMAKRHELKTLTPQFVWENGTPRRMTREERAEEDRLMDELPTWIYVCPRCAGEPKA